MARDAEQLRRTRLVEPLVTVFPADAAAVASLSAAVKRRARQILARRPQTPTGAADLVDAVAPEDLAGLLASGLPFGTDEAQRMLAEPDVAAQLRLLIAALDAQLVP